MRSENTHPVAHPFRGEAFRLLASSVFLSPRWRLTVTGEYSTGKNKASSGKSVGNWRAQRDGSLRNRWSLRHVASRECCASSEPLWISGPPSA